MPLFYVDINKKIGIFNTILNNPTMNHPPENPIYEITNIAAAVEALRGQTDSMAAQKRISASVRLIETSRGRLSQSRGALAQLYREGAVSEETFQWLRDRFDEEACRNEDDGSFTH
jgi:hypothetical protein